MPIKSFPSIAIFLFAIVLNQLLSLALATDAKEEFCSADGCEDESTYNQFFTSENAEQWIDIKENIAVALSAYKPCKYSNCSCFTDLVSKDLAVFTNGISKEDLEHASTRGTRYQIIDHKLYRDKDCMFPSRCSGIEHFIKAVIEELPDMDLIVNTRDWPQASRHFGQALPVFSFSKTDEYYDITYPAWTFWEGGPAISLYPTGLGRWDKHRVSLNKASLAHPWDKKLNKAFFRGSRTSSERDPLVLLSREKPSLVDAQYTKNQAWKSEADTLGAQPAKEVALEDHCTYKYLFNYRGVAASFRFKHLFLCKSLVFHVGSEWIEFFYPALKPWVHYVPVSSTASKEEIARLIHFAQANDDLVAKIATRGHTFVWNHLKMSDVECYWKYLLTEYAKLLRFKPARNRNLIPV